MYYPLLYSYIIHLFFPPILLFKNLPLHTHSTSGVFSTLFFSICSILLYPFLHAHNQWAQPMLAGRVSTCKHITPLTSIDWRLNINMHYVHGSDIAEQLVNEVIKLGDSNEWVQLSVQDSIKSYYLPNDNNILTTMIESIIPAPAEYVHSIFTLSFFLSLFICLFSLVYYHLYLLIVITVHSISYVCFFILHFVGFEEGINLHCTIFIMI